MEIKIALFIILRKANTSLSCQDQVQQVGSTFITTAERVRTIYVVTCHLHTNCGTATPQQSRAAPGFEPEPLDL
jgi:hypothetical protein